jgi:hypothetical protein
MNRTWNDELDFALKNCVAAGHSFANIAVKINREFGATLSRNACIGRAQRLGLSVSRTVKVDGAEHRLNRKPEGKTKTITIKPKPQFACEPATGLRVADVVPLNISIYDLNDSTCRWPLGEQAPFTYCGCHALDGVPYCWPHMRLAHREAA